MIVFDMKECTECCNQDSEACKKCMRREDLVDNFKQQVYRECTNKFCLEYDKNAGGCIKRIVNFENGKCQDAVEPF